MSMKKEKGMEWLTSKAISEKYGVDSNWASRHHQKGVLERSEATQSERKRHFPKLRAGAHAYMYRVDKAARQAIEATKQHAARRAGKTKASSTKKPVIKTTEPKKQATQPRRVSAPRKPKQSVKAEPQKAQARWFPASKLLEEFGLHPAWLYRNLKKGILKRRPATREERATLFEGRLQAGKDGYLYLVDDAVLEAIAVTQSRSRKTGTKQVAQAKQPHPGKAEAPQAKEPSSKSSGPEARWLSAPAIAEKFDVNKNWAYVHHDKGLLERREATIPERETSFERLPPGRKAYLYRIEEKALEAIEATKRRAARRTPKTKATSPKESATEPKPQRPSPLEKKPSPSRARLLTSAELQEEFGVNASWVQTSVSSGLLERRPATQEERKTRFKRLNSSQKGWLHRVDGKVVEAIEAFKKRIEKQTSKAQLKRNATPETPQTQEATKQPRSSRARDAVVETLQAAKTEASSSDDGEWLSAKAISEKYGVSPKWVHSRYYQEKIQRRQATASERKRFFAHVPKGQKAYVYHLDGVARETFASTSLKKPLKTPPPQPEFEADIQGSGQDPSQQALQRGDLPVIDVVIRSLDAMKRWGHCSARECADALLRFLEERFGIRLEV